MLVRSLAPGRRLKSLVRLLHFPGVFLSIAAASLILAVASSSGTFFLSSAGNAALEDELGQLTPEDAGVTASIYGHVNHRLFDRATRALTDEVEKIPHLDPLVVTAISNTLSARSPSTEARAQVQLLFRSGATAHIEKLEKAGGSGVWVPDNVAEALEVDAGDKLPLVLGDRKIKPRIAGIYRNLPSRRLSDFWRPLTFELINPESTDIQPPPPVIADKAVFFHLGKRLASSAEYRWQFPFGGERITLAQAQHLRTEYAALADQAADPSSRLRPAFERMSSYIDRTAEIGTLLPSFVGQIEDTVASLDVSIRLISLSGQGVALIAIAGAAMFGVRSRITEMRLLVAQGVGPLQQGARASAEAAWPVALGALIGWVVASQMIERLGPSELITPGVATGALKVVLGSGVLALVVIGIVVAVAARRQLASSAGTVGGRVKRLPWELVLLLLAGASLYETFSGRSALIEATGEPPQTDIFVLAFPILFIAGMAGVAVRGLRRILPRMHRAGHRAPAGLYLASRRLTGTSSLALLLVAIAALSIGVLVYAGALTASTEATVEAKALVATGSDVAISIAPTDRIPKSNRPTTKVGREEGDLLPDDVAVDVLQINPSTFAEAAFWDGRFSDVPLDELLARVRDSSGKRLAVIAAGTTIEGDSTLDIAGEQVPVTIVGSASAFPGMSSGTPLVVTDARQLQRKLGADQGANVALSTPQLWVKGDSEEILRFLRRNGLGYGEVHTANQVKDLTELKAISWTYGLLQAFGLMAGVLALVAMLAYLVARQRERKASYGLARRMGLSRKTHRFAVMLELVSMLLTSAVIGAVLAVAAARLIVGQIDPLPELLPGPLLDLPVPLLWGLVPVLALASVLGAWQVQRSADRADMAEVMRLAG